MSIESLTLGFLVFLESIELQMRAPISQALMHAPKLPSFGKFMHAFPIHKVSFFHDKMTNHVKLNHFDNSKIFFCESLNTWGASVNCWDHGRINQSLEPCTIDMQPMAINSFPKSTSTLTHIALEGSKMSIVESRFTTIMDTKIILKSIFLRMQSKTWMRTMMDIDCVSKRNYYIHHNLKKKTP